MFASHCLMHFGTHWFPAFPLMALPPGVLEKVSWGQFTPSSPIQAGWSLVFRHYSTPNRHPMGDSHQAGPAVRSRGPNSSSPDGVVDAIGLAPEGDQLQSTGLST